MYEVMQEWYVEDAGVWLDVGMMLEPDALDPEVTAELVFAGVLVLLGSEEPDSEPEPDEED